MGAPYAGIEKYIFADVYNFFLKYKDIPNEDYYWECCVNDAKILCFKYKEHRLARSMITSVLEQLEHKVGNKPYKGLSHEQWEENLNIAHKVGW